MRVLLVDDDPDTRDAYTAFLRARGVDVSTAATGVQALNRALLDVPDMVILDVLLPEMDGWETLRQLKSRLHTKKIPVIVLSGHVWPPEQIKVSGCALYLQKPCRPDTLFQAILDVLPHASHGA